MFIQSFIDLLNIFTKINNYASNTLAKYSLLYSNTFNINLYTVDEYLNMSYIYSDFIKYYERWYLNYFNKK
jgi:hypothetical protein